MPLLAKGKPTDHILEDPETTSRDIPPKRILGKSLLLLLPVYPNPRGHFEVVIHYRKG